MEWHHQAMVPPIPDQSNERRFERRSGLTRVANLPSRLRHQEKVRAHAERRLAPIVNSSPSEAAARKFRAFLRLEDERLRVADRLGAGGRWLAWARSFTIDLLVQNVFRRACRIAGDLKPAQNHSELAIVAMGGYGRAELAPFSDLDILFLCSARTATTTSRIIEYCQHLLWDTGLTLGQKTYPVTECVPASRTDPHFQTSLINTRLIAGDHVLYTRLSETLAREREKNHSLLLQTVKEERKHLYQKRGVTIYLQEPNIKESAGGLRDLHCALWAVYAQEGHRTIEELLDHRLIEAEEYDRTVAAYDFLLRVRHQAHWLSGRKTDHLALDLHDTIARKLGYTSSLHLQASEELMRDYYRHARELHHISESLFGRLLDRRDESRKWFSTQRGQRLDDNFLLKDSRLHFDGNPHSFAENPILSLKAAALAQAHTADFSPALSEIIRRNLAAIDANFRKSPEPARSFLELLRPRGRVAHALRLLQKTGLLGRYLPEFDRVSMLIQHDLYHHYTVDEHTLRAIEALDDLNNKRDPELSSLRAALEEIDDVRLLYLALLLHDLGKGRGRGHIPRGARIAERICVRFGLDAERATKVVSLVKHHVLMAHLSQRRDLREPRLAKHLASQIGSLDVLNMLFILTYADLNGVGPAVWSDWKGTLLEELYVRTRAVFTGESLAIQDDVQKIKARVIERMAGNSLISDIERHFALSPARYLEAISAEEVQSHLHLVQQLETEAVACRWQDRGHFATQLTICSRDRHGLFADLAGTLAARGIDILSAEVNTREDGIAIDSFVLQQATTHRSIDRHRWPAIQHSLAASIKGEHDVAVLVERWSTRHAPRRARVMVTSRTGQLSVECDNEAAEATTLVEVRAADEHGLAYKIARTLAAFGVEIICARIATEKSDALDVFYVTAADGSKLDEASMKELKELLISTLAKTRPAVNAPTAP
jgi:[protein-PII] uridylyltransferase